MTPVAHEAASLTGQHEQPAKPASAPFFIVGTQRSGTTLLRLLLNAHPALAIPEEARFLTPLLNRRLAGRELRGDELDRVVEYLRSNEQLALWNFDMSGFFERVAGRDAWMLAELLEALYGSYAEAEGKERWGDKSLFFDWIDVLLMLFPTARFVHVVRDGRDAFLSWRKYDPAKNHPSVMALDWAYKLRRVEHSLRNLPAKRCMTIRYEDMLRDPEATLRELCRFIGLTFEPQMLEFYRTSDKYIGDHHSQLIFRPIDAGNVAKWSREMSKRERKMFELCAGAALRRYDYPLSDERLSPVDLLATLGDLAVGLPRRAIQVLMARFAYRRALARGTSAKGVPVGAMPRASRNESAGGENT